MVIMRMTRALATSLLIVGLAPSVFAQGPRQDGQWELKIEISMPGIDMPPQTQTQCITPAQVRDQENEALPGLPGGGSCKRTDYQTTSNRVTFKLKCDGTLPLTGTSEMTYSGDTVTGALNADLGGQPLTIKYSGKRLGDCKQ
jgi:hypothetical protein